MLDFTCAGLLTKEKSRHEVFKQKVELNFQNSEVELLRDSLALVTPWANILPMLHTQLSLIES